MLIYRGFNRIDYQVVVSNIFFMFTPTNWERIQFDDHIFQMGWFNHQLGISENSRFSPQIIHFNWVFHYVHHPFWGPTPIFGNIPKWSFLVGKPMVVGYHHFRKTPYTSQVILTDSPLCVDRPRYPAIPHGHPHRLGSHVVVVCFYSHIYMLSLWFSPEKNTPFFFCWENLISSLKSLVVSLYSGYYIYI